MEEDDAQVEIHDLVPLLPEDKREDMEASILVARGWVKNADELLREQLTLTYDTQCLMLAKPADASASRDQVKNRIARHNLCFAEESQEADISSGKGTVISFREQLELSSLRQRIIDLHEKTHGLNAEGNHYYNLKKCYIGWHGDAERRRVIGVRLGPYTGEGTVVEDTFPLRFEWYEQSQVLSDSFLTLPLGHEDLYIMSEKAVGTDWLKKKIPTLRHSAGRLPTDKRTH